MIRQYRHIISLGSNCRAAYQIHQTFSDAPAYPFDWWITPLEATARFLEEPDLRKLYNPDLLELIVDKGTKSSVVNTYYDIRLYHEFPRDENGVVDDFRDHVVKPRKRTKHLMTRLRSLEPDAPVLFVKSASASDPHDRETWERCVRRIDVALKSQFGLENFDLLLINTPVTRAEGRVPAIHFPDLGEDWRGDTLRWTEQLSQVAEFVR